MYLKIKKKVERLISIMSIKNAEKRYISSEAKFCKNVRMSLGLTQSQFSELLGLSGSTRVSEIEIGLKDVSKQVGTAVKLINIIKNTGNAELLNILL